MKEYIFLLTFAIEGHKESINQNKHLKVKTFILENSVKKYCLSVSRVSVFLCLVHISTDNAPNLPL